MSDLDKSDQLQQQLAAYRRTLAVYLRQLGNLGPDYAPPGIHNGIAEGWQRFVRFGAIEHNVDPMQPPATLHASFALVLGV
jgi:hypothetical protein